MTLLASLRDVARHLLRPRSSASAPSVVEASGVAGGRPFGFSSLSDDEGSLSSMSAEELSAWENRAIPSIDRASDDAEARADEKQDATTSLNFPLHWTSARESWNYLFDFPLPASFSPRAL